MNNPNHKTFVLKCVLCTISIFVPSCDHSKNETAEREVRGYLSSGANAIMSSLELHGINQIPPRDAFGVEIIDKCVTNDISLGLDDKKLDLRNEPKQDPKQFIQDQFSFPSVFISSGPFVKSGFIKTDVRKDSFVFVALWKSTETQHWHKSSIILTRDRDVIYQSDEYVDDAWIAGNLLEFPSVNSKTYSMIENFNNQHTALKAK